jgi:hypothetical protein
VHPSSGQVAQTVVPVHLMRPGLRWVQLYDPDARTGTLTERFVLTRLLVLVGLQPVKSDATAANANAAANAQQGHRLRSKARPTKKHPPATTTTTASPQAPAALAPTHWGNPPGNGRGDSGGRSRSPRGDSSHSNRSGSDGSGSDSDSSSSGSSVNTVGVEDADESGSYRSDGGSFSSLEDIPEVAQSARF